MVGMQELAKQELAKERRLGRAELLDRLWEVNQQQEERTVRLHRQKQQERLDHQVLVDQERPSPEATNVVSRPTFQPAVPRRLVGQVQPAYQVDNRVPVQLHILTMPCLDHRTPVSPEG